MMIMNKVDQSGQQVPMAGAPVPGMPPVVDSNTLFAGGNNQLLICHRGQYYSLRLTRNDKLILVK